MNDNKNLQLAREITDFCKERLVSPAVKSKSSNSTIHTVLTALLTVTIATGASAPTRGRWTEV